MILQIDNSVDPQKGIGLALGATVHMVLGTNNELSHQMEYDSLRQ